MSKKHVQPLEKHNKHILTNEDWYPTLKPYQKSVNTAPQFNNPFPAPAVCVTASHMWPGDEGDKWKVSVWGSDDFGLSKEGLTRIEALELFNLISDFTIQEDLEDLGFIHV